MKVQNSSRNSNLAALKKAQTDNNQKTEKTEKKKQENIKNTKSTNKAAEYKRTLDKASIAKANGKAYYNINETA